MTSGNGEAVLPRQILDAHLRDAHGVKQNIAIWKKVVFDDGNAKSPGYRKHLGFATGAAIEEYQTAPFQCRHHRRQRRQVTRELAAI